MTTKKMKLKTNDLLGFRLQEAEYKHNAALGPEGPEAGNKGPNVTTARVGAKIGGKGGVKTT